MPSLLFGKEGFPVTFESKTAAPTLLELPEDSEC
jgi:hypothetical protein